MRHYSYRTSPLVCSSMIEADVDDDGKVHNVRFTGGCSGNLQGIAKLVEGMETAEVIRRLENISCGGKPASCPAELAKMLKALPQK